MRPPVRLPLLAALTASLATSCYRSHWIEAEGDAPPECWVATAGPTYLTEPPPNAYSGSLVRAGGELLLGYAATNEGARVLPRTVARLDDHGRALDEAPVLDVAERQLGPAVELVESSLGVVATAYGEERGCELRVLGGDAIVLTPEYCARPRANPAGGVITIIDGIGPMDVQRRFAHVRRVSPPLVVEGPEGVIGEAWSKVYEPLDRDHVLIAMADRDGGPIRAGVLNWRTGERAMAPIHETARDVRRFRLLPRGDGWLFGWIERTEGDRFRLSLMPLDAEGVPTAPPSHPDVGALPETGWQMLDRAGELVIVYTDGAELRMATVNERLELGASVSTLAWIEDLDHVQGVVLDDGAVLLSFTANLGTNDRVGTLRAECR